MMAVMTVQPPLPLVAGDARPVGAAAAIVEGGDGGRVFVHGNLAYAWDVGDCAARRFAAVSLMRIKAATQLEVAEAFAVKPATVRRWETWLTESGVVGLLGERKGPKRKSKLTAEAVARIQGLRDGGASYRAIAAETGVSEGSVRNALVLADDGARTEEACPATTSDVPPEPEPEPEPEGEPEGEPEVEKDCSAAISDDRAGPVQVPVLADPVDRGAERGDRVRPAGVHRVRPSPARGTVFGAARVDGNRAARHRTHRLRRVAQRVLLAGYDAVRERVPRPAGGGPRAGRHPDRPARAGPGAGFGPGAGGQDDPPQDRAARRGGQGRRLDRPDGAPSCAGPPRAGGGVLCRRACARLSGHP